MGTHRKTWSVQEKIEALKLAKDKGFTYASRELGVSSASLFNWRNKFEVNGPEALESKRGSSGGGVVSNQIYARLARENRQLKEIIAEKELKIRIQEELLKKSR
jgi:transposase-like protein